MNKKINLVIVGQLNFPYGSAPSARVYNYAKGIVENGGNATILCIKALIKYKEKESQISSSGIIDGIKYVYTPGTQYRSDNFLSRRLLEIKGIIIAIITLIMNNRQDKISAILFFTTSRLNEILLKMVASFINVPVVREINEYPFTLLKKKKSILHFISKTINYKLYNGVIVITKFLEAYYKPLIRKKAGLIIVPILIDIDKYESYYDPSFLKGTNYIAYCGSLGGNKDGVSILIKAFSMISCKYNNTYLYIIGDSSSKTMYNLKELAKDLNISDKVIFTGNLEHELVQKYLFSATLLALARPSSMQATAGFPTKLGEYLLTGNPVLVTSVGEIPNYLNDGENSFLVEPDNDKAFAEKMDYILSNSALAKKVGETGKKMAMREFSYKNHSLKMIKFINDLNEGK